MAVRDSPSSATLSGCAVSSSAACASASVRDLRLRRLVGGHRLDGQAGLLPRRRPVRPAGLADVRPGRGIHHRAPGRRRPSRGPGRRVGSGTRRSRPRRPRARRSRPALNEGTRPAPTPYRGLLIRPVHPREQPSHLDSGVRLTTRGASRVPGGNATGAAVPCTPPPEEALDSSGSDVRSGRGDQITRGRSAGGHRSGTNRHRRCHPGRQRHPGDRSGPPCCHWTNHWCRHREPSGCCPRNRRSYHREPSGCCSRNRRSYHPERTVAAAAGRAARGAATRRSGATWSGAPRHPWSGPRCAGEEDIPVPGALLRLLLALLLLVHLGRVRGVRGDTRVGVCVSRRSTGGAGQHNTARAERDGQQAGGGNLRETTLVHR